MRSSTILSSAVAAVLFLSSATSAVTGIKGDAPTINTNPDELKFMAALTNASSVMGMVTFQGRENGTGVEVNLIKLNGFPTFGGPFLFHVHQYPVAASDNGNCMSTGAHLDPYLRGEVPPCNASAPETCQVGDLSDKHGKIPIQLNDPTPSFFSEDFIDNFISTDSRINAYIGGLSIVIHLNDPTRIACANITMVGTSTMGGNMTTDTNASTTTTMATPPVATNAASSIKAGTLLLGSIILAFGAVL